MNTLYRSVLIESAEQAEALPAGTLAHHAAGSGMDHAHKLGPLPGFENSFMWISLSGPVVPLAMVGWTALVPIEAEEHVERHWCSFKCPGPHNVSRAIYRTPWEEA